MNINMLHLVCLAGCITQSLFTSQIYKDTAVLKFELKSRKTIHPLHTVSLWLTLCSSAPPQQGKVMRMMYVWALCRDQEELNPNAAWRLLDISASSTEQAL